MSATTTHSRPRKQSASAPPRDRVQEALEDLGKVGEKVADEARTRIDSAVDRIRDASDEMTGRGHDQLADWQDTVQGAAEDMRREFGRIAIRAQRSPEALTALSGEIRKRRAQLAK